MTNAIAANNIATRINDLRDLAGEMREVASLEREMLFAIGMEEAARDEEAGLDWLDGLLSRPVDPRQERIEARIACRELEADKCEEMASALVPELRDLCRCTRCSGRGYLSGYEHVAGGVCFACGGNGLAPWAGDLAATVNPLH